MESGAPFYCCRDDIELVKLFLTEYKDGEGNSASQSCRTSRGWMRCGLLRRLE
jgi:hypothetical protein